MQKIRILTELSPTQRKPHGLNSIFRFTHVLCPEWSCRYFLRHETKNWSHFTLSCCYIAGIPTTLFLIWGKPSCFLYETVACLLSGRRGEVKNVSANQRPRRPSYFSDRPEKHKLGRGRWDLAPCQVSLNSVQRFQRRSWKCVSQSEARAAILFFWSARKTQNW